MKKTKVHSTPACPYTFPHRSRADKVGYICSIGGYSSRSCGRFPISFEVSAGCADFDFDHIWGAYRKETTPSDVEENPGKLALYEALARRLYADRSDYLWGWGQEDAVRGLTDGDTYKQLWDGTEVDAPLTLAGRSGKHLVIESFNGLLLRGMNEEDMRDILLAKENGSWFVSTEKVDLLYRYVRQCAVDFTPQKASAEVEYQGAFCFFANIVDPNWEEEEKNKANHEAVVGCAQTLRRYLGRNEGSAVLQMLRTLSIAAGVSEDELWAGD